MTPAQRAINESSSPLKNLYKLYNAGSLSINDVCDKHKPIVQCVLDNGETWKRMNFIKRWAFFAVTDTEIVETRDKPLRDALKALEKLL